MPNITVQAYGPFKLTKFEKKLAKLVGQIDNITMLVNLPDPRFGKSEYRRLTLNWTWSGKPHTTMEFNMHKETGFYYDSFGSTRVQFENPEHLLKIFMIAVRSCEEDRHSKMTTRLEKAAVLLDVKA